MHEGDRVSSACALGLQDADCELVAARENHVYRVQLDGQSYALRLHRKGLHTDAALWSELQWMAALAVEGVGVPAPVVSTQGSHLEIIDGVQVDVLTWLPGRPLGSTTGGIDHDDRAGVFFSIGREMARLHRISDDWVRPSGFSRWSWDRAGLVGDTPVWHRFWDNPTLSDADRALFVRFRAVADTQLLTLETKLDYGLIHADLVRENVMIDGDHVALIDFDDAGFGFRLFDIATTLLKNLSEPDYDQLRAALLTGYQSQREIEIDHLDLFMALRATTYVGWVSARLHEDGSDARNRRFIDVAKTVVSKYLEDLR